MIFFSAITVNYLTAAVFGRVLASALAAAGAFCSAAFTALASSLTAAASLFSSALGASASPFSTLRFSPGLRWLASRVHFSDLSPRSLSLAALIESTVAGWLLSST